MLDFHLGCPCFFVCLKTYSRLSTEDDYPAQKELMTSLFVTMRKRERI